MLATRSHTSPKPVIAACLLAVALATAAQAGAPDLTHATIAELDAAMAKGKVSSEQLTKLYLKRIDAFDKQGPGINAVITLNPKALETARALDKERKKKGPRGPLHGIPIVLKDNFDTFDLPTTAGSQLLAGSIPPDDAYVVKKLRDAGAVIVAKVNLSEFAGSGGSVSGAPDAIVDKGTVPNGFSSMGLQTHNPHDLERGPAGSSGGTGAAIAAGFAQFGLGTDTGGSVRGPSSANGIVGLKPTHGLMSRDGIVPLALSFDTGGPMARSVYDVAVALGAMTGVDPADPATRKSEGHFETDYTKFLKVGSLKARASASRATSSARMRAPTRWSSAIATMKSLGAEIVDPVAYPFYLLQSRQGIYNQLVASEFKAQITDYLHAEARLPAQLRRSGREGERSGDRLSQPREGRRAQVHAVDRAGSHRPGVPRDQAPGPRRIEGGRGRAVRQVQARCDRVSDLAAAGDVHRPDQAARARRFADQHRERDRLSGSHRARGHDARRPARDDLVLRSGVQRTEAARLRLRLRAGDARDPHAEDDAGAAR